MSAFLRLCCRLTFEKYVYYLLLIAWLTKGQGWKKIVVWCKKSEKCGFGSLLHIIYEAGFTAFVFGFSGFVTKMFYTTDNCLKAKLVKIRAPKQAL